MRITSIILVILLLTKGLLAQAGIEPDVDSFIRAEMQKQKIPGVSLAVVEDGNEVL